MQESSPKISRSDGIIAVIALLVLLSGLVLDSARVMCVMSLVGLAVITVFYRNRLGRKTWMGMVVGAIVAALIAWYILFAMQ